MVSYLFVLQFNAIVVFLLVWPRVRPKCIKKQIRQQVGLKIMVPLTYHNKFEGFFFHEMGHSKTTWTTEGG